MLKSPTDNYTHVAASLNLFILRVTKPYPGGTAARLSERTDSFACGLTV